MHLLRHVIFVTIEHQYKYIQAEMYLLTYFFITHGKNWCNILQNIEKPFSARALACHSDDTDAFDFKRLLSFNFCTREPLHRMQECICSEERTDFEFRLLL